MDPDNLRKILKGHGLCLPEVLTLALTEECNLACAHCWVDAGPSSPATPVPELDVEHVIREFSELGGHAIRLTGGEPLLHPAWFKLMQSVQSFGLKVLLQTNGTLIDKDCAAQLCQLELSRLDIQISLDGAFAPSHDLVRGAGAFEKTLQGITRLVKSGLGQNVSLFFTEMHHNLAELPELFRLAAKLEVKSVSSGCLVACGRAGQGQTICPPDPEQYTTLLQQYAEDEDFRRHYKKFGNISALEWCDLETSPSGCSFIKNPYVTAQGVLYPCLMCHADHFSVADFFEKGLPGALVEGAPLWERLQSISRQRVSVLAECQSCVLLSGCAGGCMGRAWGSYGDFFSPEDRCRQRLLVARWKNNR